MSHPRWTRRTLVGAAAWSAPAVVALAAAPAAAASAAPRLILDLGATYMAPAGNFYDVVLSGATITSTAPVPAGTLSLIVTFHNSAGEPDDGEPIFISSRMTGWNSAAPPGTSVAAVTYVYGGYLHGVLALPRVAAFGTGYVASHRWGRGTFTVTVSSAGFAASSATVTTPQTQSRRRSTGAPPAERRPSD